MAPTDKPTDEQYPAPQTSEDYSKQVNNQTTNSASSEQENNEEQSPSNQQTEDEPPEKQQQPSLTRREICNLVSLVFCYACVICSTTLVVGTSAVIVLSVGGSSQQSPFALAMFFVGSACISLLASPLFSKFGRKTGFLVGVALGLLGATLGMTAIVISSPILVILASMPLGAANGIGFYLRFAAVEVVPQHYKSLAVTLVLMGGVIAAFAGPETAQATKDIFGDDLTYLGTYMMIGVFNVLDACFTCAVKFPSHHSNSEKSKATATGIEDKENQQSDSVSRTVEMSDESKQDSVTLKSLLCSSSFFIACAMATASWCIMAMPMSIVRVAMRDVGFTSRQSLTTIELHFLGMYAPGFCTGKIINRFGAHVTSLLSILCFVVATVINLFSDTSTDGSLATWILGLCIVGVGWNLGFSSATVMLTRVYENHPKYKARCQASNDFIMFLISGGTTFSTGYIYNGGGGLLNGWKTVNYVVLGMIGLISMIMIPAYLREKRRQLSSKVKKTERDVVESNEATATDQLVTSESSRSLDVPPPATVTDDETGFELSYDCRSIHSEV